MLATVTNTAKGARGFATLDHGIVMLEAEGTALLDLADHPLHRAWAATGEVRIAPLAGKDEKAARSRLDREAASTEAAKSEALGALPPANPQSLLPPAGEGGRQAG